MTPTSDLEAGMATSPHRSTRRPIVVLLVSILVGLYSVAGYFTAGMLQPPGYRTAAWIYLGTFAASVLGVVAAAGALVQRRLRRGRE